MEVSEEPVLGWEEWGESEEDHDDLREDEFELYEVLKLQRGESEPARFEAQVLHALHEKHRTRCLIFRCAGTRGIPQAGTQVAPVQL